TAPVARVLPDGSALVVEPLLRTRGRLGLKNFDPCTILLNDDLSAGLPPVLEHLHEQYLLPPLHAGWTVRRKSRHFQSYEEVAKKFAKLLGMDPWLINPMHAQCGQVDFGTPGGLDCVRGHAEAMLTKVRRKYKEYGINEKPFVMVKSDHGTSGRGLMTVRDVKDLDDAERLARLRSGAAHGGTDVTELIIQEGVPTYERIDDAAAEPVVCMIDRYVVGGFYRSHAVRAFDESLAAPDADYVQLAFAESTQLPRPGVKPGASAPNRFYMYGVIGRLAMLAAAYELEATDPDAESYE
ncbi:MAG TPA: glutamate--cysteine ligase, partial [Rubrivivax sp.]|nr:glutamate--cysteine ligase [Rubrivivax sp.]